MSAQSIRRGFAVAALVLGVGVASARGADASGRLRALILSGQNNHDWKRTTPALRQILADSGRFSVDVTDDPAACNAATFAQCDVIVSNWTNWPEVKKRVWGTDTETALVEHVRGGKGFVVFHAASTPFQTWPAFQQMVGSTWELGKTGHGLIHTFKVSIADRDHPITRGMGDFSIKDELWHRMRKQPDLHVLCTAWSDKARGGSGEREVVAHCTQVGKGRCFNLVLGHDVPAMQNVGWRTLMTRGCEWAATGKVTIPLPAAWPTTTAARDLADSDWQTDLKAISTYTFGQSRKGLARVERRVQHATSRPALRRTLAAGLVSMLDGKATLDAKKFVCRQLAMIGTAAEVPALARLLNDKDLSFAARAALQQIPDEHAAAALRSAMRHAKGRVLTGLINTLGERRDAGAADIIARHLADGDPEIAAAAVDALGKIRTSPAIKLLVQRAKDAPADLRGPLSDALLRAAEALTASGQTSEAASVYETLSAANAPPHVRLAAFPRWVECSKDRGDAMLLDALGGADPVLQSAAARCIQVRIAKQADGRGVELFAKALGKVTTCDGKRALIGYLSGIRRVEAMQLARSYLKDAALSTTATTTVMQIAAVLPHSQKEHVKDALQKVLTSTEVPEVRVQALALLLRLDRPPNLALGAKASSPDGLDKDQGGKDEWAAIDGNPRSYWDEVDDQKLYRLKVTFKQPTDVSAISILGHQHHNYAPKDFEILCDDKVVEAVRGAIYHDNELVVFFPRTRCGSLELKITGYYGRSPAVRELGIYDCRVSERPR